MTEFKNQQALPVQIEFEVLKAEYSRAMADLEVQKKRVRELVLESSNKRTSSSGRKSKAAVYVREKGLCAFTDLPSWNPDCYHFGRYLPKNLKKDILKQLKDLGHDIDKGNIKDGELPLKHTSVNSHVAEHAKLSKDGKDANSTEVSVLLCTPVDTVFNHHRLTVEPTAMKIEVVCPKLLMTSAALKLHGKEIKGNDGFPPKDIWEFHYKQSKPHKCTKECNSIATTFEEKMR